MMAGLTACARVSSPCPSLVPWSKEDSAALAEEWTKAKEAGEYPLMRRATWEYHVVRRQYEALK